MSREFQIDRMVDSERYVATAIIRNTRHGDWIIEFTTVRTDLPDTREWWSLVLQNESGFEHLARLEVDGNWVYTSSAFVDNDVVYSSIATPGQSAQIQKQDPCSDVNLSAYKAILAQVAPERSVIGNILDALDQADEEPETGDDPPCVPDHAAYAACAAQCPGVPQDCNNPPTCEYAESCCLWRAAETKCKWDCLCHHDCPWEGREKCLEWNKGWHERQRKKCQEDYDKCIAAKQCQQQ